MLSYFIPQNDPLPQSLSADQSIKLKRESRCHLFSQLLIINNMDIQANEQRLWGKGSGSSGVLNKTDKDEQDFVPLPNIAHLAIKDICMTSSFLLLLTQQNGLLQWGMNNTQKVHKPLKILEQVRQISCGWEHALMTTANRMFGIGSNAYHQLGFGSADKYEYKVADIILEPVSFIAAGFRQSYIIWNNQLKGCGESKKYQLGKKEAKKLSLWSELCQQMPIQGNIIKILCGKRFLLILNDRNKVYGYGCNEENCFGDKTIPYLIVPTIIFRDVRDVVCGWAHIIILKIDNSIQSYGRSNLGQLGHNLQTNKITFELEKGEMIKSITSGSEFSFAVTNEGRLYGWGWNEHYNILPNQQQIINKPIQVPLQERCKRVWTNPALTIMEGYL